jgi:roadblock/LC7 domain-containing protein
MAVVFTGISATPASFVLRPGLYAITANAGAWGTVTLQRLSSDATTYVTCATAVSADGFATVNLPGGTYRLLVAGATGVFVDISPIAVPT